MKPEKQRIAIAEACGWTDVNPLVVNNVLGQGDNKTAGIWGKKPGALDIAGKTWIPDYLNSLDAMHGAEKTLNEDDRNLYIDNLGGIFHDSWEFATATAPQRAEAFLKTLGLWEEEPRWQDDAEDSGESRNYGK